MNTKVDALLAQIGRLERDLAAEFARRQAELKYGLEKGRVIFEEEIRRRHEELKVDLLTYVLGARLSVVLTAPVIYGLVIPLVLLDLFVTVYQAVCFPVYGIAKVRRRDYLIFDRHYLGYLNALEMLNCAYCSYANGLLGYAREIAARTEQYWCPIKHARRVISAHGHYAHFSDYGDGEAYRAELGRLREALGQDRRPGRDGRPEG